MTIEQVTEHLMEVGATAREIEFLAMLMKTNVCPVDESRSAIRDWLSDFREAVHQFKQSRQK